MSDSAGPQLTRGGYCPDCGTKLEGAGALTCPECGYSRTRYPLVGVAVVIRDETGRVLLGRRTKGRDAGKWCIPCGRLEWGEDVRSGALRELEEETGLKAEITGIASVQSNFHRPDDLSVGIWFFGRVLEGEPHCADGELDDLGFFAPEEPPPLAFPTDASLLAELAADMD